MINYNPPPPNSVCSSGETVRYFLTNILEGRGMAVCMGRNIVRLP